MRTTVCSAKQEKQQSEESKPLPPLDQGFAITVLSCDPGQGVCSGCGERRLIYQAHYFAFHGPSVRARCKPCHEKAAKERGGDIFVKTFRGLPDLWKRDRRDELSEEVKEARRRGRWKERSERNAA